MHALALSLLLAAPTMPHADAGPVAVLTAPATSTVGTPIYLDLSGSSGAAYHFFVGKKSPSQPKVVTIKDDAGNVVYGLVVPQVAGDYTFGLAAWGPPVPPPGYPAVDVTTIRVTVAGGPPPGPTPPPAPTALTATFQAAYALETDAGKATYLSDLTATFQGAATLITPGMTVAQLGTALSAKIHAAGQVPAGDMPHLTAAITAELSSSLGTDGNAAVNTATATAEFANIAAALGGVVP